MNLELEEIAETKLNGSLTRAAKFEKNKLVNIFQRLKVKV
jgi:hypothetical protein